MNFSQQVLQEFQIGRPTLIHRWQKILHGVAKLFQAHAQTVVGKEAPAALRAAIQVANTFPDFEDQGFASGAVGHGMAVMLGAFSSPGPPLLAVKFPNGRARIGPVLFVLLFEHPEEHIRRSFARRAELLDPFREDLRIAKRPKPLKCAPRRFPHGFPVASRIEVHHYFGDEDASAQGDAQVVDGLRRQGSAHVCMFFENAVRPIREADFFFGSGMRLRQNGNQYPSERSPGGAILAARDGKTQISQGPK